MVEAVLWVAFQGCDEDEKLGRDAGAVGVTVGETLAVAFFALLAPLDADALGDVFEALAFAVFLTEDLPITTPLGAAEPEVAEGALPRRL